MSVQSVIDGRLLWHCDVGETLRWLKSLPAGCVHNVTSSPPYYGCELNPKYLELVHDRMSTVTPDAFAGLEDS